MIKITIDMRDANADALAAFNDSPECMKLLLFLRNRARRFGIQFTLFESGRYRDPLGMPTEEFVAFVQSSVEIQLQRRQPVSADLFTKDLWSAAEFDSHRQTGERANLIDGAGVPKPDAQAYGELIKCAGGFVETMRAIDASLPNQQGVNFYVDEFWQMCSVGEYGEFRRRLFPNWPS